MNLQLNLSRRGFLSAAASVAAAGSVASSRANTEEPTGFRFRYLVASCMYGYAPLAEILPEVTKAGSTAIDLWPKVHGNQREEIDTLGEEAFAALLERHAVRLGCLTQYKLGPLGLADEIPLAARLGCSLIVTGAIGPAGLAGDDLKVAVQLFVDSLRPTLDLAAEHGVTIAVENHGHNLVDSPDALKWLVELRPSEHLGVALAPYHLPQQPELLAALIRELGNAIEMFYAWQHGLGCMEDRPLEEELLQLPGRGELDFIPLAEALCDIDYQGWTEIFMHPFPRGIPILDSREAVTAEINRSRDYLDACLSSLAAP
jgi:sugar phosphate isomerase/epimerase